MIFAHVPSDSHIPNHRWDVERLANPFSVGTSIHLAPVMRIHTIVLRVSLKGAWGRPFPGSKGEAGRRGSMIAQAASVKPQNLPDMFFSPFQALYNVLKIL